MLGIGGMNRSPSTPDTQTVVEAGLPGCEISAWYWLYDPASMPKDIVDKIQKEIARSFTQPDVKGTPPTTRRRAAGQHTGRIQRLPHGGNRQVEQASEGFRRQIGMKENQI